MLLSVFLLQFASRISIYADYMINKDYISEVLCVNRDEPEMHCNGECHLKSEIEKEEKSEKSPINTVKDKNEIQLFSESNAVFSFSIEPLLIQPIPFYHSPFSVKHTVSIFHPPSA